MLAEKIISDNGSELILYFKEWTFGFPNSPDYEFLANDEKLIIEYKGERIVEFTFFLDKLHIKSSKCLLSIGNKNVCLKCENDEIHNCLI
jgi:hypothetical protein